MAISQFEESIRSALEKAGLPPSPCEVIGRHYLFGCEYGSHHVTLTGIVTALEVSDEGGLDFYVTNPRFGGERLISIKYSNNRWAAFVDVQDLSMRFFTGTFTLYSDY